MIRIIYILYWYFLIYIYKIYSPCNIYWFAGDPIVYVNGSGQYALRFVSNCLASNLACDKGISILILSPSPKPKHLLHSASASTARVVSHYSLSWTQAILTTHTSVSLLYANTNSKHGYHVLPAMGADGKSLYLKWRMPKADTVWICLDRTSRCFCIPGSRKSPMEFHVLKSQSPSCIDRTTNSSFTLVSTLFFSAYLDDDRSLGRRKCVFSWLASMLRVKPPFSTSWSLAKVRYNNWKNVDSLSRRFNRFRPVDFSPECNNFWSTTVPH